MRTPNLMDVLVPVPLPAPLPVPVPLLVLVLVLVQWMQQWSAKGKPNGDGKLHTAIAAHAEIWGRAKLPTFDGEAALDRDQFGAMYERLYGRALTEQQLEATFRLAEAEGQGPRAFMDLLKYLEKVTAQRKGDLAHF